MADLPEPNFIERDPAKVESECVAYLESPSTGLGRPLQPSQVERIVASLIAYRESLLRVSIQQAAKQCLVKYAIFPMIDFLAQIGGVARLDARKAVTSLTWTLPSALGSPSTIPVGTRVRTKDGKVEFETDRELVIATGATTGSVTATARTAGVLGNGYVAGQVSELVAPLGFTVTVANTTTTEDGAASEDSDALRSRLPIAIRGLSVAGPEDAYAQLARAAHPDILEVAVTNPSGGLVRIVVLAKTGVPSGGILTAVTAACSPKTVRPICDTVESVAAAPIDYAITAALTLRRRANQTDTMALAQAAAVAFAAERAGGLGRSLVPSQVTKALSVSGVYGVTLTLPVATTILPTQWARNTAINLTFAGFTTAHDGE